VGRGSESGDTLVVALQSSSLTSANSSATDALSEGVDSDEGGTWPPPLGFVVVAACSAGNGMAGAFGVRGAAPPCREMFLTGLTAVTGTSIENVADDGKGRDVGALIGEGWLVD